MFNRSDQLEELRLSSVLHSMNILCVMSKIAVVNSIIMPVYTLVLITDIASKTGCGLCEFLKGVFRLP